MRTHTTWRRKIKEKKKKKKEIIRKSLNAFQSSNASSEGESTTIKF